MKKKILFVGLKGEGQTSAQRIRALESLGHIVIAIDASAPKHGSVWSGIHYRAANFVFRNGLTVCLPDLGHLNERIIQSSHSGIRWDLLWLDKPLVVKPETIRKFRCANPAARVISYSPDDMFARHNQSAQFLAILRYIDAFITTKSYNVEELKELGCAMVLFVDNGYDPATHRPFELTEQERKKFGGPVGFIGAYEIDRALFMNFLADNGVSVRIWGPRTWKGFMNAHPDPNLRIEYRELLGDDYARAISAFDINLCFLRKINRDLQTTRSIEIPACSGFMLAERSSEHLQLFREGKEAAFFSTREELLHKVHFYLERPHERIQIARAGRERCIQGGYNYASRLNGALEAMEAQCRRTAS